MPQFQGLVLTAKGDVKVAKVTSQTAILQLADIQKYLKKKTGITLLGKYSFKGTTLFLFGAKEGKAGTENKHELPPPLDSELFFGDILLIASKNSTTFQAPIPFTSQEYETFYTKMFEGFEDLDEDEGEGEEEEDEEEDELEGEGELELNEEFIDDAEDVADDEEVEEEGEEEGGEEKDEEEKDILQEDDEEVPVKNKVIQKEKKPEKKSTKKSVKNTQLLPQYPDLVNEPELELEPITSIGTPSHPNRKKVYEVIKDLFKTYLKQNEFELLEHYLFNSVLQNAEKRHIKKCWSHPVFEQMYKAHCRSVILNFHPGQYTGNKTLMERYKEGKLTLEEIAQMNYNDLYPEIWKDLSFRQFEREKRQLEGNKSMATDQFRCHRCGKKECTYYELQTRSADEPMTIFIQCVNCGKHWRQ